MGGWKLFARNEGKPGIGGGGIEVLYWGDIKLLKSLF